MCTLAACLCKNTSDKNIASSLAFSLEVQQSLSASNTVVWWQSWVVYIVPTPQKRFQSLCAFAWSYCRRILASKLTISDHKTNVFPSSLSSSEPGNEVGLRNIWEQPLSICISFLKCLYIQGAFIICSLKNQQYLKNTCISSSAGLNLHNPRNIFHDEYFDETMAMQKTSESDCNILKKNGVH